MTKSVLFLDVDGVLNCPATWKLKDGQRGTFRICPDRVKLFDTVLEQTDCRIVMSSTWRKFDDHMDYLKRRVPNLKDRLHKDWRTVELPCRFSEYVPRGREINEWLSRHPEVTRWAIVDDDSDMLPDQQTRFVNTSWQEGLTESHAKLLIELLIDKPAYS